MWQLRKRRSRASFVYEAIVACATGYSHVQAGKGSEDAHSSYVDGSFAVGVVADGAGSAARGAEGARRLVTAVLERLKDSPTRLALFQQSAAPMALQSTLEEVIEGVRLAIIEDTASEPDGGTDSDRLAMYHSTLVGFVVEGQQGYLFHLGDGLAVALPEDILNFDGEWYRAKHASLPEEGEYAGQAFFFSMSNWRQHLRVTPFDDSCFILAMTDGVSPFVLNSSDELDAMFLGPILRFTIQSENEVSTNQLTELLSNEASQVVDDDKTLLIVQRRAVN